VVSCEEGVIYRWYAVNLGGWEPGLWLSRVVVKSGVGKSGGVKKGSLDSVEFGRGGLSGTGWRRDN
jgi:hypothetical protein